MANQEKQAKTQNTFAANVADALTSPKNWLVAAGASLLMMTATSCASTREVTPGRAAQGGMKCGWRVR